jgi:hypothetical protein
MKSDAHGVIAFFVALNLMALESCFFSVAANAEEGEAGGQAQSPQPQKKTPLQEAVNPLTDLTALQVQNYAIPLFKGNASANANFPYLRAIFPYSAFGQRNLVRISLPAPAYVSTGKSTSTGIGDLDLFSIPVFGRGRTKAGVGPWLVIPTNTSRDLGLHQWQIGAQGVVSRPYRWGLLAALVGYRQATDGNDKLIVVEPFIFRKVGQSGYYIRSSAISMVGISSSQAVLPIGLGLGKVTRMADGNLLNVYVEPQVSTLAIGNMAPQFQVLAGFNVQFVRRP